MGIDGWPAFVAVVMAAISPYASDSHHGGDEHQYED